MTAAPDAPIGEDDLHALVDGVLDPARAAAVQRYLAAHSEEAARVRDFVAQRNALRAALAFKAAEPIPARLRVGALHAARRSTARARGRVAAAAAMLLLAGAGLGWTVRGTVEAEVAPVASPSAPATLHQLLATAPRRAEASAQDTDIPAWLAERLGEPVTTPDLAAFGFTLELAWVLPGSEGPSAMLRYVGMDGATLSFWRRPTRDPVVRELRCADEPGGLVTYTWSNGIHLHAVTAALPRERLRPVALAIERAMKAPPTGGLMAGLTRRPCEGALG